MSQSAGKGGFMPFYRWKQLTMFTDSIFRDFNYIANCAPPFKVVQPKIPHVHFCFLHLFCNVEIFSFSVTEFIADFFFPSWADFEGKVRWLRMSAIKNVAGHKDQELIENKAELYKLRIKYYD